MSGIEVKGRVGEELLTDGAVSDLRLDRLGALVTSDQFPRFYELNRNGRVYSDGMGLTAINNATYTSATTGATATPIAGVWNPAGSDVNLVILRLAIGTVMTAATNTGPGGYVFMTSTGNAAISTGSAPLSRKTMVATGSKAKGMSNVALTGLTNNLVVRGAAAVHGGSAQAYSHVGTAVGVPTPFLSGLLDLDGAWIVPPGAVLAVMATTTPVAHSASSTIIWAEIPV